jgi:hypothetical protein
MSNILLGYLTGRQTFATAGLTAPDAGVTSEPMEALRQFLGLTRTDTDWAVMGMLAAVESAIDLWPLLPVDPAFTAASWIRPDDIWKGGTLIPDAQGPVLAVTEQQVWPTGITWNLYKIDSNQASLQGEYQQFTLPVALEGMLLKPVWPEDLGWQGHVQLDCNWDETPVMITHLPQYPAEAVVAAVSGRSELPNILHAGRTLEAWHVYDDPVRKLAALGTALIRLASSSAPEQRVAADPPTPRSTLPPTNS